METVSTPLSILSAAESIASLRKKGGGSLRLEADTAQLDCPVQITSQGSQEWG
jgi:hypothetical protein